MFFEALKQIKISLSLLVLFTVITGMIYPMMITAIAQLFFPWKANGSLIIKNQKTIGSELIGQYFTENNYFWGRPSATLYFPYNAKYSSASNLSPSNPVFINLTKERAQTLQQADLQNKKVIPIDLVTASGSGLDPDISPLAAFYQVSRIAKARGIPEEQIKKMIKNVLKDRTFGVLGEPRVNVILLNLALDHFTQSSNPSLLKSVNTKDAL